MMKWIAGKHRSDMWLLMLASVNLYLLNASNMVFMDPDEARCVLIAREMLTGGDYLAPHEPLQAGIYHDKPILYFWMLAGTFRMLGVTELSARLLSAVGGALVVGATYRLGQILVSPRAGLAAAAMLGTSAMMIIGGRFVRMDIWLTAFVAWALVFWARVHFEQASQRCLLYGYACLAAAFLTKGLVGLLLPAAAVGGYLCVQRDWVGLRRLHLPLGAIVVLLLAGPWYGYMECRFPGYLADFFWRHHVLRATTGTFGRSQTVLFLPGAALAGMLPWTFLLLAGIARSLPLSVNKEWVKTPGFSVILSWAAFGILPFALSRTQLPVYIMPAFPSLAIIGGWCLDEVLRRGKPWEVRLVLYATLLVMALSLIGLAIINRCTCDSVPWVTLARRGIGFGVVMAVVVFCVRRASIRGVLAVLTGACIALAVDAAWVEGPAMFRHFSSQPFVKELLERGGDVKRVTIGPSPRYALPLYLNDKMPVVYLSHAIDFLGCTDEPGVNAALLTSTNLYELAKGQLDDRMELLYYQREDHLVKVSPAHAVPVSRDQNRPAKDRQGKRP